MKGHKSPALSAYFWRLDDVLVAYNDKPIEKLVIIFWYLAVFWVRKIPTFCLDYERSTIMKVPI